MPLSLKIFRVKKKISNKLNKNDKNHQQQHSQEHYGIHITYGCCMLACHELEIFHPSLHQKYNKNFIVIDTTANAMRTYGCFH